MIRPLPTRRARPAAWVCVLRLVLLCAGVGLLSTAGYILIRSHVFQIYEGRAFDYLSSNPNRGPLCHDLAVRPSAAQPSSIGPSIRPPFIGEPVARMEIPGVGLSTLVMEGDDASTLRLSAGHIPGTALPGTEGNIAIAGHRDTVFRCLRSLRKNELITLDTPEARYTYRVETLSVVNPSQTSVLAPTHSNTLTLVTCYPFYFIGPAPQRFIVTARQISALKSRRASLSPGRAAG